MGLRNFAVTHLPAALTGLPGLRRTTETTTAEAASFDALVHRLDYLSKSDVKRVRDAYKFADEAHLGQFRASGEPYITHPLAVAGLCADWRLDAQAIMAAVMHDAMEDCGITKTELISRFEAPTAELVDGLTKLDKLQFTTKVESQAENFRKMLLAMARDVRVILIKLADRLHNMRTIKSMKPEKQAQKARETMEIYAPLAGRMGMQWMREELEDLSFRVINPEARSSIIRRFLMLQREAARLGRAMNHRVVVTNFEAALRVVRAGLAISLVPREVAGLQEAAYGLRITPLAEPWAQRRFIVCFRDANTLSPAAQLLVEHLAAKAAPEPTP